MKTNADENSIQNVCRISYLSEIVGGNKQLMKTIMDAFLVQVSEELQSVNDAIKITDYVTIKQIVHTMQTTVSIVGISVLAPVLKEMEELGALANDIEKIKQLNLKLNLICNQAIEEIERETQL